MINGDYIVHRMQREEAKRAAMYRWAPWVAVIFLVVAYGLLGGSPE